MLCLSRKKRQSIVIGEGPKQISVQVIRIRGNRVWLAFEADKAIKIMRSEIISRPPAA